MCAQWKMSNLNRFSFLFWKIALIGCAIAYPDKYEIQDADSNVKFNLLDILPNDSTENDKEHRRDSLDPLENWTGKWMPSRRGEYTPPPKIPHRGGNVNHQMDETEKHPMDENKNHPMGVLNNNCDDGKTNLTVDWDGSESSYACYGSKIVPDFALSAEAYCEIIPKHYVAMHKCMYETIEYYDDIPLYGTHRPIWPVYGEYKYVPKQRWLHNLEHGGVVMLYHPCANKLEVQKLKELVKNCLRRHIITPYNLLDEDRPLALLTWGCRLTMSHVNKEVVVDFIREHALHAPEQTLYRDGDFNDQLIEQAKLISDVKDSLLCSKFM